MLLVCATTIRVYTSIYVFIVNMLLLPMLSLSIVSMMLAYEIVNELQFIC